MSHANPGPDAPHATRDALQRAQRLSDSRPVVGDTTRWHHEALHVGDLSALVALALRT